MGLELLNFEFQNSKSHSPELELELLKFQNSNLTLRSLSWNPLSSGAGEFEISKFKISLLRSWRIQNSKSHSTPELKFKIQNSKSHSSGAGEFKIQNLTPPELKFKIQNSKIQKFKNSKFKIQNLTLRSWRISKFKISLSGAGEFQNSKSHSPELENFKIQNLTLPELENFKIQNLTLRSWRISNSKFKISLLRSGGISKFKKLRENFEIQKAAGEFSREFQLRAQLSKTSRLNSQNFKTQLSKTQERKKNHEIMKFVFCPKQQKNSF